MFLIEQLCNRVLSFESGKSDLWLFAFSTPTPNERRMVDVARFILAMLESPYQISVHEVFQYLKWFTQKSTEYSENM